MGGWHWLSSQGFLMRRPLGKDLKEAGSGDACMLSFRGVSTSLGVHLHRCLLEWVRTFPWSCFTDEDIRSQRNPHRTKQRNPAELASTESGLFRGGIPELFHKTLVDSGLRPPFPSAFHTYVVSWGST